VACVPLLRYASKLQSEQLQKETRLKDRTIPNFEPKAHGVRFAVSRTVTLAAVFAACGIGSAGVVHAETWPAKPIQLVVGNAPGGSNDTFARMVGKRLQESWGQPVIVENKPAAQGVIGNAHVSKAKPDGYTIGIVSSTFTTSAAIQPGLPYDAITGFTPVAMLARGPLLFTVSNQTPFKKIEELVAYAKANPGKLNYATSGSGSINNFATNLFAESAGIKLTHIPYKGMAPAVADLIGGQTDMLIASAPSILQHVNNGKVRALAVTSGTRSSVAPDLPSLEQSGYKNSAVNIWWGIMAPPGTPQPVVDKLNAEINRIVHTPEMKAFFLQEGAEPAQMKPAEFSQYIAAEISRWKQIAARAGIKAD
jgi:tripartite-type tricarboxylate transporter receptor subunit TctC